MQKKRDVTTSMTDVALGERKEELSLFPTPSPAREPLVRYLQVKVNVKAMSEPGISLHPISETDEEMTTRSRARSPAWKIINHHMGEKSSSLYLSHITYHIHAGRKGTNEKA